MNIKKILSGILITTILFTTTNACMAKSVKVINSSTKTVNSNRVINNYNDFYNAIQGGIKAKKGLITLKIKNYSNKKYEVFSTMDKIQGANPKLNYLVSSIGYDYYTKSGYSVVNIKLIYTNSEGIANNYNDFYRIIKSAVINRKEKLNIKLNNYKSNIYSLNNAVDKLQNEGYEISCYGTMLESTPHKIISINILYNKNAYGGIKTNNNISSISVKNSSELYSAIKKCLTDVNDTIKLTILDSKLSNENYVIDIVDKVIKDNPNLKYHNYLRVQKIGNNYIVKFDFNFSRDRIIEMNKMIDEKSKFIISKIIKVGMTDYEKEKAIHDYIVNNTVYDSENYDRNTIPKESYTSYGALINGVAVCEGYANAIFKLMNEAGIECKVITGYAGGGPHAWNLVKINGRYYNLDATWDDPVTDTGINMIRYDYFNKSDDEMSKTHSWDKQNY